MSLKQIPDIKIAIKVAINEIKLREHITNTIPFYAEKGLAGQYIVTEHNKYCLTFQKRVFERFRYMDENILEEEEAVSFRSDQLYHCIQQGIIPMIVLPNHRILIKNAKKWMDWSIKYKDNSFNSISKPISRKITADNFVYFNLPLSQLADYKEVWKGKALF